jgi:DNA-binding transcriptional MerR regulator
MRQEFPSQLLDAVSSDPLLTTGDVAELTRAPASTVRYWRHIGCGPRGFRIGRRVLYRRSEVLRWLAEQEAAGQNKSA